MTIVSLEMCKPRLLARARRRTLRTIALLAPAAAVITFAPSPPPAITTPQVTVAPRTPAAPPFAMGDAIAELNARLESQRGHASAVILDTAGDVVYENAPDKRYELASVSKLYILAAYLDHIERQDREANEWEDLMMKVMIEESDNRSASDLWTELGEAEGLQAFLEAHDLEPVDEPEVPEEWGEIQASAIDVGTLLRELYNGRLLNQAHTRFALDLLGNIIEEQAWGVGSVQEDSGQIYVKNGWYPEEWGWTVNSTGIVTGDEGSYVIVFLTDSQPSLEEGVDFIEDALDVFKDGLLTGREQGRLPADLSQPRDPAAPVNTP